MLRNYTEIHRSPPGKSNPWSKNFPSEKHIKLPCIRHLSQSLNSCQSFQSSRYNLFIGVVLKSITSQ